MKDFFIILFLVCVNLALVSAQFQIWGLQAHVEQLDKQIQELGADETLDLKKAEASRSSVPLD